MRVVKNTTRFAWFLFFFATFANAADPAGEAYEAARASHAALKAMPEEQLKFAHNWRRTIEKFDAVSEKYPKSWVADDALYMSGTLYYELYDRSRLAKDLRSAVEKFDVCSTKFPSSNYADDCLYWQAKAFHLLDKHDDETKAFQTLLDKHPKGDMAKVAKLDASKHKLVLATAEKQEPATPKPAATAPAIVQSPERKSGGEAQDESQQLTDVKVWSNEGYTRVGIYLGGKAKWTVNDLKADGDKPPRVYIDFTRAHVGEDLKAKTAKFGNDWEVMIGDGLLQRARVNQFSTDTVRVVLDVATIEKYEVVQLDDPFRVLIDVTGVGGAPITVAQKEKTAPTIEELSRRLAELEAEIEKAGGASPRPTVTPMSVDEIERRIRELAKSNRGVSLAQQLGLKATRIYVDAGHGGDDPGAVGPGLTREKDVTLAIAKKVKQKLIALGYDAILTRTDDTRLALEDRTGIANGGKGDLFVSIHCNSRDPNFKTDPSGVETYYASSATDEAAKRLSAIENATSHEKVAGIDLVIESLARSEYTVHSAELATSVQKSLAKEAKKHNPQTRDLGVKSALFYVLLTARMPAILVETAFISNAKDEKRLKDSKYQDAIAESIAQGIERYLESKGMKIAAPKATPAPTPKDPQGR